MCDKKKPKQPPKPSTKALFPNPPKLPCPQGHNTCFCHPQLVKQGKAHR